MKQIFVLFLILFGITGCDMSKNNSQDLSNQNFEISDELIDKISSKKIYFGHHSIGYNILKGVEEILTKEQLSELNIIDSMKISRYESNQLGHSRIGYNTDPYSKIDSFTNFMDNIREWQPDLAMFRFCYIDFNPDTRLDNLFNEYYTNINLLKNKHPDTKFVHITVPLTTVQGGLKAAIKKLIGKPLAGVSDNIARNKYNEIIRKTYSNKEPIFDLARYESTLPGGDREIFEHNNTKYYALANDYSSDGAHLNSYGRKVIAREFLLFLSKL